MLVRVEENYQKQEKQGEWKERESKRVCYKNQDRPQEAIFKHTLWIKRLAYAIILK